MHTHTYTSAHRYGLKHENDILHQHKSPLCIGFKRPWKQALFQMSIITLDISAFSVCAHEVFLHVLLPLHNCLHVFMFAHTPDLHCACASTLGRQYHVRGMPPTFLHLHCFYIIATMLCPRDQLNWIFKSYFQSFHLPREGKTKYCALLLPSNEN